MSKPKCEACEHPARDQLDVQLARGVAVSIVADAYKIPLVTMVWHWERHLPGVAKKSGVSPHDLVDDLAYIRKRAEDVLQAALEGEKLTVALTAIREFRETVLSIAKLTHADAALDPMRILALQSEVKDRILKAVEGFPDVRDRLIAALQVEDKSNNGNS